MHKRFSNSILSAKQFNKNNLLEILDVSEKIERTLKKQKEIPLLKEYILATLFFEPSTRTRLSFEAAMHRLGGKVITSVGMQFSSLAKGETLFDTLKMVEAYADICAIRHPVEGASVLAAENISIPVINAGDGAGEHPTQALLDLYTINKHKSLIEKKLKIAFIGDIRYGRTIHSLIHLLKHFECELTFISPSEISLPEKYKNELNSHSISFLENENLNKAKGADVLYVTRIQEERFTDRKIYEKFKDAYIIDKDFVFKSCPKAIVMHPLPRLNEVSTNLDDTPNAVYFDQAKNGLYTRMALILKLLNINIE
ncbi:MAG: aspartate carbamoyltransferase [Spirochaetia bacterium]|nr:aspartate carbamoyltransferase [Spirochaetia bacterium]